MTLRTRLILVFLAATLIPLAATWWIGNALLEHSLTYSRTDQLDQLSLALERTGRELYQSQCDLLRNDAALNRVPPRVYLLAEENGWPADVREFWDSGEPERFAVAGDGRNSLVYLKRHATEVRSYARPLDIDMAQLAAQYRQARETVERDRAHDLRRGFFFTFALLATSVWLISLSVLVITAHRITLPIRSLAAALGRLAGGDLSTRIATTRTDEVGRAISAFNHMAAELENSRDRIVYLAQMASWQLLARKMAHELKNSLTPIRLTMEEVLARRSGGGEDAFLAQAARIVIEEVESLERRVRAFSQFAAEPPVNPAPVDANGVVKERVGFLRSAHPEVSYTLELDASGPQALADAGLLNGILTNLLENAADAAGRGGEVLALTCVEDGRVRIEVHDSGPGLSEEARRSLFEPTISFKKGGMGLGLSIARKNAMVMAGDLEHIPGRVGGAAFRLTLPAAEIHRGDAEAQRRSNATSLHCG